MRIDKRESPFAQELQFSFWSKSKQFVAQNSLGSYARTIFRTNRRRRSKPLGVMERARAVCVCDFGPRVWCDQTSSKTINHKWGYSSSQLWLFPNKACTNWLDALADLKIYVGFFLLWFDFFIGGRHGGLLLLGSIPILKSQALEVTAKDCLWRHWDSSAWFPVESVMLTLVHRADGWLLSHISGL